ncbi:MAG: hypothetical protein AB7I50_12015, partial [Vicinamibacterales bacterium]
MGATVNEDLTIIEASSAKLPPRLLRWLANREDVLAISTDADITADGITTSVTGTSQNSAYSLRRTLGLDGSIDVGATSTAQAKTASLSWSHTVAAGSNRLLIVRTSHRDGNKSVTGVTFGGSALTKLADVNGPGNQNKVTLWYRLSPSVGTATVVVTLSGSVDVAAAATSFTGVSQTAPVAGSSATG